MWKTTWSREKRNAIKQSRGSRPEEKQIFRVTRLHRSFDNRKQGRSEKFLKLSYEFDSKLSSQFPRSVHIRAIRCDSYRFFILHFSCRITWLLFLDNTRYKKNLENYNYFIYYSLSLKSVDRHDALLRFRDRSRVSTHRKSRNKGEHGSLIAKSRTITEEPEHEGSFISYISGFN